jgi:mRNA interferase RelE/StbE
MLSFEIFWKRSAEKDLRKLPEEVLLRVLKVIESLEDNPIPRGVRKIEGTEMTYRIKVSDYRIIYQFDKESRRITLFYIRHRKDAYKNIK